MKRLVTQPERLNRVLGGAVLLAVTLLAYLPALRGEFIWDDDRHVSQNRMLHDLRGLQRIWLEPGVTPQYYPMTHTSFWLEYRIWGLNPTGYHATNIFLHGINAILVWLLLRRLEVPGAFLAAAVFALHPLQVESVAWISERKNLLATCFVLLSILAYLRFDFTGYVFAWVLFLAALFSKTITASMPAVMILLLWWMRRLSWKEWALLAPMFLVGGLMGLATARMEVLHVGASGAEWDLTLPQRFVIAGRAIWFYVGKLLWPAELAFSYPRWTIDPRQPAQWAPLAAAVLVVAILFVERQRFGRGPLVALLIFIGTLVPALGFFNTYPMRYSFVADHFVYLSSIAFIGLVVGVIATAYRHWLQRPRIDAVRVRFALANSALLLAILAVLTFRQAGIYSDAETLWRDTIQKNPQSWMARNNLAVLLSDRADEAQAAGRSHQARPIRLEAIALFRRALELHPRHEKVRFLLAEELMKLGDHDEAIQIYEEALAEEPNNARWLWEYGVLLGRMNRFDAAERALRRAVEADASLLEARYALAELHEHREQFEAAMQQYARVLQIDPRAAEAHRRLAMLLYRPQVNRLEDSAGHLERYLELAPGDADAHATLGFIYGELSRFRDARRQFERALELNPQLPAARRGIDMLRSAATAPTTAPR